MDIVALLAELVAALRKADPWRIVLFGSQANGTARPDSDIDIMVILDNEDVAQTYTEHIQKRLYIRGLVREVNRKTALDILVYSRAEYRKVKAYGNFFVDEVEKTGRVIYEKGQQSLHRHPLPRRAGAAARWRAKPSPGAAVP